MGFISIIGRKRVDGSGGGRLWMRSEGRKALRHIRCVWDYDSIEKKCVFKLNRRK